MKNENHFCSYIQVANLKNLGVNISDYFCVFIDENNKHYQYRTWKSDEPDLIRSPLRSQIFEFFRNKYNLYCEILLDQTSKPKFCYHIYEYNDFMGYTRLDYDKEWSIYRTYAECESDCIDKLIQITLTKKQELWK